METGWELLEWKGDNRFPEPRPKTNMPVKPREVEYRTIRKIKSKVDGSGPSAIWVWIVIFIMGSALLLGLVLGVLPVGLVFLYVGCAIVGAIMGTSKRRSHLPNQLDSLCINWYSEYKAWRQIARREYYNSLTTQQKTLFETTRNYSIWQEDERLASEERRRREAERRRGSAIAGARRWISEGKSSEEAQAYLEGIGYSPEEAKAAADEAYLEYKLQWGGAGARIERMQREENARNESKRRERLGLPPLPPEPERSPWNDGYPY